MPSGQATVRSERRGRVLIVRIEREALTVALGLADDTCASSPVSVAASLAALTARHDAGDAAGWAATAEAVQRVTASDDMREGIAAFFKKRPPRWTGR